MSFIHNSAEYMYSASYRPFVPTNNSKGGSNTGAPPPGGVGAGGGPSGSGPAGNPSGLSSTQASVPGGTGVSSQSHPQFSGAPPQFPGAAAPPDPYGFCDAPSPIYSHLHAHPHHNAPPHSNATGATNSGTAPNNSASNTGGPTGAPDSGQGGPNGPSPAGVPPGGPNTGPNPNPNSTTNPTASVGNDPTNPATSNLTQQPSGATHSASNPNPNAGLPALPPDFTGTSSFAGHEEDPTFGMHQFHTHMGGYGFGGGFGVGFGPPFGHSSQNNQSNVFQQNMQPHGAYNSHFNPFSTGSPFDVSGAHRQYQMHGHPGHNPYLSTAPVPHPHHTHPHATHHPNAGMGPIVNGRPYHIPSAMHPGHLQSAMDPHIHSLHHSSSSSAHMSSIGASSHGQGEFRQYPIEPATKPIPKYRSNLKPTGVARLTLRYEPPVKGCALTPYILLKCKNGGFMAADEQSDILYRWYRSTKRRCSRKDCNKPATLECLSCRKLEVPPDKENIYFCSGECMKLQWKHHQKLHGKFMAHKKADGRALDKFFDLDKWKDDDGDQTYKVKPAKQANEEKEKTDDLYCKFPPPMTNKWEKISDTRIYEPCEEDVGRQLLLEIAPVYRESDDSPPSPPSSSTESKSNSKSSQSQAAEAKSNNKVGEWYCKDTAAVLPRPPPPPERNFINIFSRKPQTKHNFRVFSYNCLAEIYCKQTMYPYAGLHILNWDYRKHNITREILRYSPDIICLQEVQLNHFEEYFQSELAKHNFEGIFRSKTRERPDKKAVDGCAIFFNRDRYQVSNRYHVDFNETARQYLAQHYRIDLNKPPKGRHAYKRMLKRLYKGNIALILVLSEKEPSRYGLKHDVVIANTHVYWDPNFTDVKVWQTYMLCKELQKLRTICNGAPIVLCGDFNSEPNSAVYQLLANQKIDKSEYEKLAVTYGRENLPPLNELTHNLRFSSSYSKEPRFTNYTAHYKGTLDYVLYTREKIQTIGYLEEINESELCKEIALPSSIHSSDHVPLLSEFVYCDDFKIYQKEIQMQAAQQQQQSHSSSHTSSAHTSQQQSNKQPHSHSQHHSSKHSHSHSSHSHPHSHSHSHRAHHPNVVSSGTAVVVPPPNPASSQSQPSNNAPPPPQQQQPSSANPYSSAAAVVGYHSHPSHHTTGLPPPHPHASHHSTHNHNHNPLPPPHSQPQTTSSHTTHNHSPADVGTRSAHGTPTHMSLPSDPSTIRRVKSAASAVANKDDNSGGGGGGSATAAVVNGMKMNGVNRSHHLSSHPPARSQSTGGGGPTQVVVPTANSNSTSPAGPSAATAAAMHYRYHQSYYDRH